VRSVQPDHFLDDGYLPSWVPMAGAIAARTKNVRLSSDVCLLPFNHPVRLAEDLAVLDNISNGRIEVGVGMGYAPHEFRGFGLPVSRRVSLTDEGIEVLRHCFTGEKFQFPWQALRLRGRGDQAALRATGWASAMDRCDVGAWRGACGAQR
jgi:alkanesulfonate monooxygenase SsuD/methylene tetrahydromethanopterin reductase-like flavin-dependent oxidoreductase (luciferase family)